jgi:hypothetical protein
MKISPAVTLFTLAVILFSLLQAASAEPVTGKLPPQKDAEAFISAWTQAQNKGDFTLYSSLYHESFSGVKRSGPQEYHFRQRDWLADRKKMFQSKFTVTVENLQVTETDGAWTARFIQTWESGTYKDRGSKVMVLKPAAGRLLITREEMLNSTVLAPSRHITDLTSNGKLFFVVEGKYVVFAHGYAAELGQGAPQSAGNGKPVNESGVIKAIASAKVEKRYLDFSKEEFLVFDRKSGERRARISRLWLLTKYIPHFGEMPGFESEGKSLSQILAAVWETGAAYEGNVYLAGELQGVSTDSIWACRANRPRPVPYETLEDDPLLNQVEAAGMKTVADPAALPEQDLSIRTRGYRNPITGRTFYIFILTAGNPCSSEGSVEITRLFEKQGRSLVVNDAFHFPNWLPAGVFDVDGDGSPEIFFDGGFGIIIQVESRTLGGYLSVPFLDCGC